MSAARPLGSALAIRTLALLALACSSVLAEKYQFAEGTAGLEDGATRDYYNRGGQLAWDNFLGDWRDATDTPQGNAAYATVAIADNDTDRYEEWDVTSLVAEWVDGTYRNQGMLLRSVAGGGTLNYRSKEHPVPAEHPELVVTTAAGATVLSPVADTWLSSSTFRAQGAMENLRTDSQNPTLLRFDVSAFAPGSITNATLRLFTYAPQFGGGATVGVFRCFHGHDLPPSDPILGIAASYPLDQNVATDPDVIFSTGFESPTWTDEWSRIGGVVDTVDSDPPRLFQQHLGRALRSVIPQGGNTGLNVRYLFAEETGSEPEEIYFRYYLRLGDTWDQTVDGGKLPGIAGRYNTAGWGGRRSDGTNGWSARGLYQETIPSANPLEETTPAGFYVYHADQATTFGDPWLWQRDYRGYFENNRWYCIEQHARMNTPGVQDGVLRAWVDGRLAFEKTDIRFRDVNTLKIEEVWLNIYHGGTAASPADQHSYIDNVVIARSYIGPMQSAGLEILRSSVAADLPASPQDTFPIMALPWTDPEDVLVPGNSPALLFYEVEPSGPTIYLSRTATSVTIDNVP